MSRHSKNNTARGHFTYAEMQMLDYGTKKQRLGRDSMRDFDACFLCLQTARDPVCCLEGHLSCKECIYENILAQKLEIERQTKLLALQEAQAQKEQEQKEELAQQIILNEFEKSHMGVLSKTESVRGKLVAVADDASPSTQNGAKSSTVKFETALEDGDETETNQKASSICPICRKGFTNSTKLSILKGCGHVYCESCCQKFIKKDGKCQACGHKAREKDIISMTGEGSGFSSGGAKEAKKFDVAFQ
ncbi:hypothetical protein BGZ59_011185 [Podila verticillata]|nr:hypothetical protein BGZ59_011185 [Podila verticillata]